MLDYKFIENKGKECIVLLHGIGGGRNVFHKQMKKYRKEFSVLAITLPGHGNSPDIADYRLPFSFNIVSEEIFKTMDAIGLKKCHFVGISLGSVILHNILQLRPERVKSAILGGAVTKFNLFSKSLLFTGGLLKEVTPHMFIYRLFANIMMPKKNHAVSREFFIQEAKKMKRHNFIKWFDIARNVESTYVSVQEVSKNVPKLYISGEEDHLFIKRLQKDVKDDQSAHVHIIEDCGHVCNIENAEAFNTASLTFMKKHEDGSLLHHVSPQYLPTAK